MLESFAIKDNKSLLLILGDAHHRNIELCLKELNKLLIADLLVNLAEKKRVSLLFLILEADVLPAIEDFIPFVACFDVVLVEGAANTSL